MDNAMRKNRRSLSGWAGCLALAVGFLLPMHGQGAEPADSGFGPLFNGRNLDGWYTFLQKHGKNNDPDKIITIENGVIHLYKNTPDRSQVVQGYIATQQEYANYHLRVEYKWGQKQFAPRDKLLRDAGIYYHMVGSDNVWPRALQFQVEQSNVGDIVTVGNIRYQTTVDLKTKDQEKPVYLSAAAGGVPVMHGLKYISHLGRAGMYERDGWNTIEIIVRGDSAEHRLNGQTVGALTSAQRPDPTSKEKFLPLTKGRILLEIEAAEIFFRNVELKPLTATP